MDGIGQSYICQSCFKEMKPKHDYVSEVGLKTITSITLDKDHPLRSAGHISPNILCMGNMSLEAFRTYKKNLLKLKLAEVPLKKDFNNINFDEFAKKQFRKKIQKRLDLLDITFQFQRRLDAGSKNEHLNTLIQALEVRDLEVPWDKSPIPVALMSDDEFMSISLEQIEGFSSQQMRMVLLRLEKQKIMNGKASSYCNTLTLEEFLNLNIKDISRPDLLGMHPHILSLLPDTYLTDLDLNDFTHEQLDYLSRFKFTPKKGQIPPSISLHPDASLSDLERNGLTGRQLFCISQWKLDSKKSRIPLFSEKEIQKRSDWLDPERMEHLTDKQRKAWDFATYPLNKAQLDLFFSNTNFKDSLLQFLTLKQILICWKLFDGKHTKYIRTEQLVELKPHLKELCADISVENKNRIESLFTSLSGNDDINKKEVENILALENDYLYICNPLLKYSFNGKISEKQLEQWDFAKHPLEPDQVSHFFGIAYAAGLQESCFISSRIKDLSTKQILDCWNVFKDIHAQCIRPHQLQNLKPHLKQLCGDPSVENTKRIRGLFEGDHPSRKANNANALANLHSLEVELLYLMRPLLNEQILFKISTSQLNEWDFKEHPLTNEEFKILFSPNSWEKSRIEDLSSQQIRNCWPLFNFKHIKRISPKQLEELKPYFKVLFQDISGENQKRIEGIFESLSDRIQDGKDDSIIQLKLLKSECFDICKNIGWKIAEK